MEPILLTSCAHNVHKRSEETHNEVQKCPLIDRASFQLISPESCSQSLQLAVPQVPNEIRGWFHPLLQLLIGRFLSQPPNRCPHMTQWLYLIFSCLSLSALVFLVFVCPPL